MDETAKATHTPGPWNLEVTDCGFALHLEEDTLGSGCYEPQRHLDWEPLGGITSGRQYDEALANARLITAAPDLLEVAKRVVAGGMSFPKYDRELAAAAIAKAEGDTH